MKLSAQEKKRTWSWSQGKTFLAFLSLAAGVLVGVARDMFMTRLRPSTQPQEAPSGASRLTEKAV